MGRLLLIVLISGLFGCSSPEKAPIPRALSSTENPECANSCTSNERCLNTFTNAGAQCSETPAEAPLSNLVLPFDKNTEAICTHSSGAGSHSGENAFYALDLATDYNLPAATIRASADGTAYVFLGEDGKLCPEPQSGPSNAQSSNCGNSLGNHILILHSNGYASFYVHLDHPLVANGTSVTRGDAIGIEGWTGAAGHRHVHWSIQKIPGSTSTDWISHISKGWVGQSVPFHFSANQNGKLKTLKSQQFTACMRASAQFHHANSHDLKVINNPRISAARSWVISGGSKG